jgi:hypothetical protein
MDVDNSQELAIYSEALASSSYSSNSSTTESTGFTSASISESEFSQTDHAKRVSKNYSRERSLTTKQRVAGAQSHGRDVVDNCIDPRLISDTDSSDD